MSLFRRLGVVLVSLLFAAPAFAQTATRVQAADLIYEGSFRVPGPSGPGGETGDGNSFNGGGEALSFNPVNNTLILTGSRCCQPTTVAEISIPDIRNASSISALATASYFQPHTPVAPNQNDKGCGGPIGGTLPYLSRLVVSAYCYYDGGYVARSSHWAGPRNFSTSGPFAGPFAVQSPAGNVGGAPGYVAGYMALIPQEWQAALGGPALTGQCCIPIITRTSWGPAASVFNPADVGVLNPVPAVNVVSYDQNHPLDGNAGCDSTSTLFNCNTAIGGVIFPAGTASVLFFGTQGIGDNCYGHGTNDPALHEQPDPNAPGEVLCYDPASGSKGGHAYPYVHYVWAYDANDLVKVKNGQLLNWQVRPYATWSFETPFADIRRAVNGVAYDPSTKRVFVSMGEQDRPRPLIAVFRLQVGTTTPPPPPPPTQIDSDGDGIVDTADQCPSQPGPAPSGCPVVPPPPPSGGDTTKPVLTLMKPTASTVSGDTQIAVEATDNVRVVGVRFEVSEANGTWRLIEDDTSTEPDGRTFYTIWSADTTPRTIRATARDAAGNTAEVTKQVNGATPPPTTPVDQVVSDWGPWTGGDWSPCVNGTQTRTETHTRTEISPASNGGRTFPLSETRTASQACTVPPPPPPVDSCTARPVQITSVGWPSVNQGSRGLDFSWRVTGDSAVTLADVSLKRVNNRWVLTLKDSRGCTGTRNQ